MRQFVLVILMVVEIVLFGLGGATQKEVTAAEGTVVELSRDALLKKHKINRFTKSGELKNPFSFLRKKIAIHMRLVQAISEHEGIFTRILDFGLPEAFISNLPPNITSRGPRKI